MTHQSVIQHAVASEPLPNSTMQECVGLVLIKRLPFSILNHTGQGAAMHHEYVCFLMFCRTTPKPCLPAQMLLSAVSHSSTILRCDVLQLAALNPRLSELPGKLELEVSHDLLESCQKCRVEFLDCVQIWAPDCSYSAYQLIDIRPP